MATKKVRWILWVGGMVCLAPVSAAWGGPKTAVDTFEVKFDTVHEKNTRFLAHAFTIKNIGDSVLRIYQVRAYCGCTSFKSDSVVPPGKTGQISMELDFSTLREGPFYAYLRVRTNDPGISTFKLAFSGVYEYIISCDPVHVVLPTETNQDTVQTVTLYTEKPDLQVSRVTFMQDHPAFEWMSTTSMRFQFMKTGKKDREGQWAYSLKIYHCRAVETSQYGNFVAVTNHPDKRELKISGALHPVKNK